MNRRNAIAVASAAIFMMAASAMAQNQPAGKEKSSLPGGSSELQETFENWTLRCAAKDGGRICNIVQQQRHRETRQLVLAIELKRGPSGSLLGTLVLPFGLRLSSGVTLQIDEGATSPPVQFSTCLPVGCVVPLNFNKEAVVALKTGTALKIAATTNEDGKTATLSVSLKGFAQGFDRLTALGG